MTQHEYIQYLITKYYVISGTVFFGLLWLAAEVLNAYWNRKNKT